jgi:biopolymer transport protein TolR
MAMQVGGRGGLKADINVTPMIDLLLVLIIIFMVVTPLKPVGLKASLPEQASAESSPARPSEDVVVSIHKDRSLAINSRSVDRADLGPTLQEIFARRAARVLFITAHPDLEFKDVADVIDCAKGAQVFQIGLMPVYQP